MEIKNKVCVFTQEVRKELRSLVDEHSRITASDPGYFEGLDKVRKQAIKLSKKIAGLHVISMTAPEKTELSVLATSCDGLIAIIEFTTG